ncbi:type VI secretion system Vgr family protein [Marinomonas mediterranea]|uniref:type VI secretion system Vgr family protein n=1 Tax=Marinomonas mediterranea TaxID=119864 RepID=UPI0023499F74|nr:type VI secretion system tip protein TssI/VgrG [Marinomonas mediterranea]WCN10809.1 type VI secretion system tip protein VgrG [Marinomonas mediterranea]WCN14866.1 type VI secretion system tip protein VgrG [Marinomonas mediterranea]
MDFSVSDIRQKFKEYGAADASQYFLSLADLPQDQFMVLSFALDEWGFNQGYQITVKVVSVEAIDVALVMNKKARFHVFSNGMLRPVHGLVSACRLTGTLTTGFTEYTLTISSVLSLLAEQQHNRVFTDKSALNIAKDVLKQDLNGVAQVEAQCSDTEVLSLCIQYQESDLDFVIRILAKEGVFLNVLQGEGLTQVQLCDRVTQTSQSDSALVLPLLENIGAAKERDHIYKLDSHARRMPTSLELNDSYPWHSQNLLVNESVNAHSSDESSSLKTELWALNYSTPNKGKQLAKRFLMAKESQHNYFLFESNCRTIAPGVLVDVLSPSGDAAGQYRVLEVSLSGSQGDLIANGSDSNSKGFRCRFIAVKADSEFTPEFVPRAPVHLALSAMTTSELDDKGCYRIRFGFDRRSESEGASSPPIRLAQPLGGKEQGMHFPLAIGTLVSVQFENGDIERPIIQGCIQSQDSVVLVNSENANHNMIQTRGGHSLLFDDSSDNEKIQLATPDQKNSLVLDASSNGHRVSLDSSEGDIQLSAGKSTLIKSGEAQTYEAGQNFSINANTTFEVMTQESDVVIQSATTLEQTSAQSMRLQSREGAVSITSEGAMSMQTANGLNQIVDEGNYQIQVQDGSYQLSTENGITLNSQGSTISLTQGDAAIELNGSGSLVLSGSQIEISADSVSVKGGSIANN